MKYSEFFDRRKNTFVKSYELILEHMSQKQDREAGREGAIGDSVYTIVELGSSRSFVNHCFEGCCSPDMKYWYPEEPHKWDWGAGVFTKVFSDNLTGRSFTLITVDPDESAHRVVTVMCDGHPNVVIEKNDSSSFLRSFTGKIDFLYMDHMESSEEACLQHLEDCKILLDLNLLSDNAILLIDDVGDGVTLTKGKYSIPFLMEHGFRTVLSEYQVLMVRV
jgi:hypothetical protein